METTTGFPAGEESWPGIPVNPSDLPTDQVTLEESQVYPAILEKVAVSMKPSKRGVLYCAVQVSIPSGDYEGIILMQNYLPLPIGTHPNASKKEKVFAQNTSASFARFAKSFKINKMLPPVNLARPETVQAFQDEIAKFYGNSGKIMVQNQEFPEGSGRRRSSVSDYVF